MRADSAEVGRRLEVFSDRPTAVMSFEARHGRRQRIVRHLTKVLEDLPVREPLSFGRVAAYVATSVVALAAGFALALNGLSFATSRDQEPHAVRLLGMRGTVQCASSEGEGWGDCSESGPGAGVRTSGDGAASLETTAGIRLDVGSRATLRMGPSESDEPPNQVMLDSGSLAVVVPPLGSKKQFSVVTPDATVVVHGTMFAVDVRPGDPRRLPTCVRVTEGIVSVRHAGGEEFVPAPGDWGCEVTLAASEASAAATDEPSKKKRSQRSASNRTGARSSLGIEARLLQRALGAERRGERAQAERMLTELLQDYPGSVVAPEAQASLERIRRTTSRR